MSIMPAYSEFDGIPCSASKFLLRKIIRQEWGFYGYTFADYGAIQMLHSVHRTAGSAAEAGRQALEAGLDMEAPDIWAYGQELLKLVRAGKISIDLIDQAVGNILRVKFLAGLFENPFAEPKLVSKIINHPRHRLLARQAAQESIVLLKNKGNLLPLNKTIRSVAVIGPNADVAELGDYCVPKSSDVTPLEGIRKAVSPKTKVIYAPGCGLYELDQGGFAKAVAAAEQSEVAIIFVGESSMSLGGVGWSIKGKQARSSLCGEGHDRADLNLPGVQQELVEAVMATGTPTIVVLINGRPMSISWIAEQVPAILEAWYPGEEGGHALAD
ncbi:MAG: beta-glucosidase, partial [Actinobacteria bacterium]|nr:beta-glucosidase [Actinomycetota bacterium]